MAFCSKCGNKLEEGQVFCGNCGAPVVDETSDQTYQQIPEQPQAGQGTKIQMPNMDTEKVAGFMTEVWNTVKAMVTAPGSAIVRTGELLGKEACFILLGLLALVQGLLAMWSTSALVGSALNSINKALGGITSLFGLGKASFTLPYFRIFLGALLTVIVAAGVLAGALYLIGKLLYKREINIIAILKLVACSFIPFTIAILLQILLSYISVTLAIIPMAAGALISVLSLYEGIKKEFELSTDQAIVFVVLSYLVMLLGVYLITKLLASFYLKGMTKSIKNTNPFGI